MNARPFHRQRPLAVSAAAYGIGVWAGVSFAWIPVLPAAGLTLGLIMTLLLPRMGKSRAPGAMVLFLFLGMLLGGVSAHPQLPQEGPCQVTGTLSQDAALRADGKAAGYLENVTLKTETGETRVSRLYWTYRPDGEKPFLPREGDQVSFQGEIYHPSGQVNPYGYDFRMYLLGKGIPAGVTGDREAKVIAHPGRGLWSFFYRLRQSLLNRTRQVFGEDSALPEALLLGERESLPEETVKRFSDAGAAHVLAVSGLHVGLMAAVLMAVLRRFLSPKRRMAALALFLLCYCALLGFPAPVVRASVLMMITSLRKALRRAPDHLTALCAAFFLILLFRPLDLFSASFQLSFCAVLGIITLGPAIQRALRLVRIRSLREGVSTTVSATVGVALPTVQVFHKLPLLGVVLNPLFCAVFSALLPAYGIALMAGCVYLPAGMWLSKWINPVTRGLVFLVEWVGRLPFAYVTPPNLPWYAAAALVIVFALCTRYVLMPWKRKAALALALLSVSGAVWHFTACRDVRFIQLAMGQADSAVILENGETVLIDAGAYGGDLASYLLATGRRADHLILTHLHADHCMGVEQLMENGVPIGAVYLHQGAESAKIDEKCKSLIQALRDRGVPIRYLAAGDTLRIGRVTLTVTWPVSQGVRPDQDANRYSMVLLCDLDGVKLLTAGDVTGNYENYAARDADILKAAHHGSKSSTGEAFLSAVSPSVALITAGPSASMPSGDTLARLSQRGIQVLNTARCGAITLTVRNGAGILTTFLKTEEAP